MIITYQGVQSFRIQFGDTVIAYNPISKKSKHSSGNFGADIVLSSLNHPDFNGIDSASRGDKEPFAITGPGEYEIKGVAVQGYGTPVKYDGKEKINTIYLATLENINLCFLGTLESADNLTPEIREALDDVDILFAPIGGDGVLSPSDAYKLSVKLEPSVIIPMHYGWKSGDNSLKTFLKEGGVEGQKPQDKLTIKRKDLDEMEGEIVVLGG